MTVGEDTPHSIATRLRTASLEDHNCGNIFDGEKEPRCAKRGSKFRGKAGHRTYAPRVYNYPTSHGNLAPNQFTSECRQLIKLVLGPAVFDCDVLALDQAAVFEALTKCAEQMRVGGGRCAVEEADDRHRRLLRARRERPRGRRAADKSDELAPAHSITSSSSASSVAGTSRPSVLAVLRLMINWIFV